MNGMDLTYQIRFLYFFQSDCQNGDLFHLIEFHNLIVGFVFSFLLVLVFSLLKEWSYVSP